MIISSTETTKELRFSLWSLFYVLLGEFWKNSTVSQAVPLPVICKSCKVIHFMIILVGTFVLVQFQLIGNFVDEL